MAATEQSAAVDASKLMGRACRAGGEAGDCLNTAHAVTGDRTRPLPGVPDPRPGVPPARPPDRHPYRRAMARHRFRAVTRRPRLCNATNGRLQIEPTGVVTVQAEGGAFSNAACFTSLDGPRSHPDTTSGEGHGAVPCRYAGPMPAERTQIIRSGAAQMASQHTRPTRRTVLRAS